MDHDQEIRYSRHLTLPQIGRAGQEKLLSSKVLVIGAGGLGSPLLLYLAASGVGTLGIVDSDKVDLSNLQRQIIHETCSIGSDKTQSAKDSIHDLNPDITINCYQQRLDGSGAENIIKSYDIIADCSDNVKTRLLINDLCYKYKKPLVSAAISGFEGQLATFRAFEKNNPCYLCLYPFAENIEAQNCSQSGVMSALAGIAGVWQAAEVIKEILGIGESLAGHLVRFDIMKSESKKIKLRKNKNCKCCG